MPQNVFEAMRVGEGYIITHIHVNVFLLHKKSAQRGLAQHGVTTAHQPHTACGNAVHINDSCFLVWELKLAVTTVLEIINERNKQTSLLLVEEYVPVFLWTLNST